VRLVGHVKPIVIVIVIVFVAACGGEPTGTLNEIQTRVFTPSCTFSACHQGSAPAGGLDLTAMTHSRLVGVPSTEKPTAMRVAAGAPDTSYVMDKLLNRNLPMAPAGEVWTSMPPGGTLEADRMELIRSWIAAGAAND
jgi:hypothetical protein